MDSLQPADMQAVIERTTLKPTKENFLLPVYEGISNAIFAAQERWKEKIAIEGKIKVDISTGNFSALVVDNGIGLNDDNYSSFKTPFTSYRLKKGGKGFGRFIAFKVFEGITYNSAYEESSEKHYRAFDFDIYQDKEFQHPSKTIAFPFDFGCAVLYQRPNAKFQNIAEQLEAEEVVERIIRYFLPNFLSGNLPDLNIVVDGVTFDAKEHFKEFFVPQVQLEKEIEIDGTKHKFNIDIAKVEKNNLFENHVMLLFADGRIIGNGRNIENKIGKSYFLNEKGEKQIYVATVSSDFLKANTARTQIEAEEKEIDEIVKAVSEEILDLEKEFVQEHRSRQTSDVKKAIIRNPLLRTALKDSNIEDYVSSHPIGWKTEDFVADLALERFRDQEKWEKVFDEGLKAPEKLKEMREQLFDKIESENKDALASYISHRKSVLELAEKILGFQEDGKMSLEDMFHDLVYTRYEDSDSTKFYQHNLWLIDEKLSFFSYCSSDRTNHGGRRQKGDKVADLVFFEDCAIYEESDHDSLVMVEFKRPGRADYKFGDPSKDPIQQIIETAIQIRERKSLITSQGRTVSVPQGVRISAFVVADIEPELIKICESHDMNQTWDHKGYYKYHEKKDVFVETIGYDKLLEDAKKRNAAFFDILLGDVVN